MTSIETFSQIARSFPETSEQPHFENTSFRVKKKIFATVSVKKKEAVLKLSAIDQSVFCALDNTMIYPVNGAWGKRGWTIFNLKKIKIALVQDALTCAYCEVAPKRLGGSYRKDRDWD